MKRAKGDPTLNLIKLNVEVKNKKNKLGRFQ